jgi:hypothetical protein
MAITQTGTITTVTHGTTYGAANGTLASITVPADAEIMMIGVSGFSSSANLIATNGSFDIGGNTSVGVGGASSTSFWQCALHYILSPATGTQNLDWQWGGGAGTALTDPSAMISYWFLRGIDTGSPTRDSDGTNGSGATQTTPTLTALSGDLIVMFGGSYDGGEANLTYSFAPDTTLENETNLGYLDGAWGTAAPTGNQTVTWTATGADEGAIAAFVLKAAVSSASASISASPSASASSTPSSSASPSIQGILLLERPVFDYYD